MKKVLTALIIILILVTSFGYTHADGYTLKPGIKEYTLSPGQVKLGEIIVKSNESLQSKVSATVETYDPQTEQTLNKKAFVSLSKSSYTIKPGAEIQIDYALSIPKDTPSGSYFNIVTITEVPKDGTNDTGVSIKKAIGAIIAMHVIDSQKSIESVFFDQSTTSLNVINKGFPYISEPEFEYTYTNNSNFVFRPEGEIRILDQEGKQVSQRFEINGENKAIYPGESFTQKFKLDEWSTDNALRARDIIARTYSGYGNNYITDKVTLSLRNSLLVIGATVAIILLIVLSLIIGAVRRRVKKSKQA